MPGNSKGTLLIHADIRLYREQLRPEVSSGRNSRWFDYIYVVSDDMGFVHTSIHPAPNTAVGRETWAYMLLSKYMYVLSSLLSSNCLISTRAQKRYLTAETILYIIHRVMYMYAYVCISHAQFREYIKKDPTKF
ncbi:uncharacterized protein H6S33_012399 [Morchella sextelata]|uniref:uncharacterized protein n=1 Tax=Morchella sextelata TaxID=1174677 RepID=UPI001D059CDB|nr:uncharacterized protein H6S33_012399 [Morchella sextelata]KAH0609853.1 hypothetical protein H6S33_012399 [Morchella sextelata]